jgi:long-chain acyl-CoA synthetase
VVLVVIEPAAISAWAKARGFQLADPSSDPRVQELILTDIRRLSSAFRSFEVPRRVQLIAEDFTTGSDLLTLTLKLKRRNVELRYGAALEALYGKLDTVVSATA